MAETDKLVEQLSNLSVLEIAGLVKQLEEKWGVSAAAPVAIAAGPAAGGAGGDQEKGRGRRREGRNQITTGISRGVVASKELRSTRFAIFSKTDTVRQTYV